MDLKPPAHCCSKDSGAMNLKVPSLTVKEEKPCSAKELNPGAQPFTPNNTKLDDHMESFIQFMASRELISNKIEEFGNSPINYNTWKVAFKNMVREVKIKSERGISPHERLYNQLI